MTLMMMNFETVAWFVMNKDDFIIGSITGNYKIFYCSFPFSYALKRIIDARHDDLVIKDMTYILEQGTINTKY